MSIKKIPEDHIALTGNGLAAAIFQIRDAVNILIEKENAREEKSIKRPAKKNTGKAKAVPDAKAQAADKEG